MVLLGMDALMREGCCHARLQARIIAGSRQLCKAFFRTKTQFIKAAHHGRRLGTGLNLCAFSGTQRCKKRRGRSAIIRSSSHVQKLATSGEY